MTDQAERTPGTLLVTVVTPEGAAYEGEARQVIAPAYDGQMAFLPGHAPLVALLGIGALRVDSPSGGPSQWFLAGGVVQVSDDKVVILAETIRGAAQLDAHEIEQELATAQATPAAGDEALERRLEATEMARAKLRIANDV